jgi:hypothetical protein
MVLMRSDQSLTSSVDHVLFAVLQRHTCLTRRPPRLCAIKMIGRLVSLAFSRTLEISFRRFSDCVKIVAWLEGAVNRATFESYPHVNMRDVLTSSGKRSRGQHRLPRVCKRQSIERDLQPLCYYSFNFVIGLKVTDFIYSSCSM